MTTPVDAAIARAGPLASLPEVAMRVMQLAENPDATGVELKAVLLNDPALCARVLKIVNSAFYGARCEVTSIDTAIMVMGFGPIKSIAVASSLTRMFRVGTLAGGFEVRDVWTHSIAVACAARLVAERVGNVDPAAAFLAGLIHDIGIIVELQACRAEFTSVIAAVAAQPTLSFRAAEQEILGATHEAFGEALCRTWRFPIELQRVSGYHHRPLDLAADDRRLTSIVYVADVLAAQSQLGYSRTVDTVVVDPQVGSLLGLSCHDLDALLHALPSVVAETAPLYCD